ncbi:MAG: haloacid dehalogenase [Candidatus Lokiarchaeota archaeon]|nr:haloacid dehalogenase [Candidatus Lokiarchaeota archaeon]
MNLKKAISEISELLEILFQDREKILKLSREIIRNCSIAIKNVHRKEFDKFQEKVNHIKINHQSLVKLVNTNPGVFFKYLKTPEQEYAESIIFYSIISKNNIPTPLELKISPLNFILGLADVIGELRRYALDNIRNSQVEDLNEILESMDEIFTYLFTIDYPSAVTQDLRHKVDVARNIIEKTRGDISLAIQMDDLKSCFEKNM